jgi:hypothetical protein
MLAHKRKQLLFQLMLLRDPRSYDAYEVSQYCLGSINWARLGDEIDNKEHENLFQLVLNARKHSLAKTPWPAVGDWLPF